jgi:dipeptidase E
VLLDAAVRAGRPAAVTAARDGLRRHEPVTGSDQALGLVDFSLYPHLEREDMPDTTLANIERWAAGISVPAYAIDDETAIKVVDGTAEVVSEGHWTLFTR